MWKRCLRSLPSVQWQEHVPKRTQVFLRRHFHATGRLAVVRPFILSDPGEGIKEVQIIQWFVEPGARVEQFDKIVEVQTDKASNEITSRFDGVIKKLHYEKDDVVQVGQALLDIDVQSDVSKEDEALLGSEPLIENPSITQQQNAAKPSGAQKEDSGVPQIGANPPSIGNHKMLATPAVRGLLKELDVDIRNVQGSGKDGRVTKEDVHKYAKTRTVATSAPQHSSRRETIGYDEAQVESTIQLTSIQAQMFKSMTKSLTIPHFVFADEVDITALSSLRHSINNNLPAEQKLSYLHFIIKAVSLSLEDFPLFNARLDLPNPSDPSTPPRLLMRQNHNIGIAMDTPQGLLVPNIKNVAAHSITTLASETKRLSSLARAGKLSARDISGGTITVSNIGSIGGTYVSPVIVQNELAILGIGRAQTVPAFDNEGKVVRKTVMNFSWSADHRVVDGATMARMATRVKGFVEQPGEMLARLR